MEILAKEENLESLVPSKRNIKSNRSNVGAEARLLFYSSIQQQITLFIRRISRVIVSLSGSNSSISLSVRAAAAQSFNFLSGVKMPRPRSSKRVFKHVADHKIVLDRHTPMLSYLANKCNLILCVTLKYAASPCGTLTSISVYFVICRSKKCQKPSNMSNSP